MRRSFVVWLAAILAVSIGGPVSAGGRAPTQADVATPAAVDESKNPHYFGPWPNWANSPYTLADVSVSITGDGTGAAAAATVGAGGVLTDIVITDPGSGYSTATVEITGGGSGAAATATITESGAITSITVTNGGAGYTAPTVTIGGGGGVNVPSAVGNALEDRTYATDFVAPPAVVPAAVAAVANRTWTATVGDASDGTFTLTVDAATTGDIAFNAVAADVEAALATAGVTATVTGSGSTPDPWVLVFDTAPGAVSMDTALLSQPVTGAAVSAAATYEVHVGSASGGTFALLVDGTATGAIAFDAAADDVRTAVGAAALAVSGTGTEADPWLVVLANAATLDIDPANLTQPNPLVPVFVVVPTELPDGTLTEFRSWNQANAGAASVPSAGGRFHAYVLRPVGGSPNTWTVVADSGVLTVPALTTPGTSEVATYDVADVAVQAGDVLGFFGSGIPVDIDAAGLDLFSFPADAAPAEGDTVDFGGPGFPDYGQARTYSFGAGVVTTAAPSQATGTVYGGVDAVSITDPGSGYTVPTVDFDMPDDPDGVKATGHVVCAETDCMPATEGGSVTITGVVVDHPGSGYASAPGVAIRNGTLFDPITPIDPGAFSPASATATLAVSSIVLDSFGSGYTTPPSVTIDDPTGSGATATATVNAGAVTGITLDSPGSGYLTQGGIRKFQDGLPVLCMPAAGETFADCTDNNLGQHIPVAVPDTTTYPGSDYYEIAVVQTRERMSSSLPERGTLLREYVQLETAANADFSKHVALQTERKDGSSQPTLLPDGSPAIAVDDPHYLGPVIVASKDRPVRITFRNLLPTGAEGDLFLPVDSTMMGSGMGPMEMPEPADQGTVDDAVRDQLCTRDPKSDMCFADNRATLHLHGGVTPWISDGTPHQWITPAGQDTPWPEGVSVENVPDMPDPGPGAQTFFYTNQQSARLMFYHDHSWGITRLNVYSGEAAGYVITDPTEQKLIDDGILPVDQIPLIIQDRTFVPSDEQLYGDPDAGIYGQDPTWDNARWGSEGDLWYHHVYMPAQNPGDPSGMSAFGRWMYGPWFWPPAGDAKHGPIDNPYYDPACRLDEPETWQYDTDPFCEPAQIPGTPNISAGMEQFNDTPVVNGTAYPTTTVQPKSYRVRVLNAANDRFWNLQWYVADPRTGTDSEVALNPDELAAAQLDPVIFPTPDTKWSPAGPSWIQIGTEGGFLPAPVVVPNQPITWITDPTRFDVGNVDQHALLLGPAERADTVVDFSKFAGKTLILYNDAPAAFPARVPQYDYYTGAPDLSPSGAPTILPGYGPNTRTVMQVKVADTAPAPAFNLNALQSAFRHKADGSGVFESGQNPIIVGQSTYNSAYGTNFVSGGFCNAPNNPSARCDGYARISDQGGDMWKFNTLKSPNTPISVRLQPKAIHDEMNSTSFDPFGRMTGFLGLEAVPATPGLQNFIPYPYTNPTTEIIDASKLPQDLPEGMTATPISTGDDGTQIWKFTHNGVDTHPIHFHLYDVQVLNRVAWDNIMTLPDRTELGWKDTVRMNPLQDTYVALRPIIPTLPFKLPNSIRPLNPMMPIGATLTDANATDPQGNPTAAIINRLVNFGWEYVYHCHILSHEEMDMMRPVSVALPPEKASDLTYTVTGNGNNTRLTLTWKDNAITETAFLVQRQAGPTGQWTTLGTVSRDLAADNTAGGTATFTDTSFRWNSTLYSYRVVARNAIGYGDAFPQFNADAVSAPVPVIRGPSSLAATLQAIASGMQVRLTFTDNTTTETGFAIERSTDGGAFSQIATAPARSSTGGVTFDDTTVDYGHAYAYRVAAITPAGMSAYTNTASVTVPAVPAAPSAFTAAVGPNGNGNNRSVILTWADNSTNETGFTIQRSTNAGFTSGLTSVTVAPNTQSYTWTGLSRNTVYWFRIRANNGSIVGSAWVASTPPSLRTNP